MDNHEIQYPGMDYEKCSICGYIPTEYLIEETQKIIEQLVKKNRLGKTLASQRKFLTEIKLKRQKHHETKET